MKKYLMTWYGIADLSASLTTEQTTGPVLGALLTVDYTDVFIFGFTNPDKIETAEMSSKAILSEQSSVKQSLDVFSNTDAAHQHFKEWLEKQLQNAGKEINVHFQEVQLRHLNDTEGIYKTVTHSLDRLAAAKDKKQVTLYLSPGTPVMAFVWAFAALKHPTLNIHFITSSETNKPAEEISLPCEWLAWHGKQLRNTFAESEAYDIIFHLFGEQRLPSLLGVRQFLSKKHIFIYSEKFPPDVMKQFVCKSKYAQICVKPYDPQDTYDKILNSIKKDPPSAKIGFNLTGGTKLMYTGALNVCHNINATPFYFNNQNNHTLNLNDFSSIETKSIDSVDTFIQLNGDNLRISEKGLRNENSPIACPKRKLLTQALWQARDKISKFYKELSQYNDDSKPFKLRKKHCYIEHSKNKSVINIDAQGFEFEHWPNFAKYLSGGWFEEYTFWKLQSLLEEGLIKDMRIGLEVSQKRETENRSMKKQLEQLFRNVYREFDVIFTDGRRLYIIECKAGKVTTEHISKLSNSIRYFGGNEGRAILVSCHTQPHKGVRETIKRSKNLHWVKGDDLLSDLRKIIQSTESDR